MIHANRFREFEERCVSGVYLADVWIAWHATYVRNQLSCYVNTVSNLMDMCKFLWAGAALIGIYLTVPFMNMLLSHKVTPRKLLKFFQILPKLHKDLLDYPNKLTTLTSCGLPILYPYYLNPLKKETSPYEIAVSLRLKEFVDNSDSNSMEKYLQQMCNKIATILKRKRVDQCGFDDNP